MIRIVIVDDSALSRAVLREILEADGDIQVVGEADDGSKALEKVLEAKPDLVTMDVDMPGLNGIAAVASIVRVVRVPIIVVTGERLGPESDLGYRAIQAGALDFVPKPDAMDDGATARLRVHVRTLVDAKSPLEAAAPTVAPPASVLGGKAAEIIAIGSGTGGPNVVSAFVRGLPADFPLPVAIVQQMPPRYAASFARALRAVSQLRVTLVGVMPHECHGGEILLVDADAHLYCPCRGVIAAVDAPPSAGQRPSANVLMRSIAEAYGNAAIGIVLSGSGEDGLDGLRALRGVGALTLAESPATARVPALPAAAVAADLVDRAISAELLCDFVLATVTKAKSKTTAPPSHQQ